jgi:hypothetical protein
VGLGVSILSYGGGVQFGVITDSTLCPDPQKIIDGFEPEFAKLSAVHHMLPTTPKATPAKAAKAAKAAKSVKTAKPVKAARASQSA